MTITAKNARLLLVVCGDTETLCHGTYAHEETGQLLCSEMRDELRKLPFVADVETDSYFEHWHGGKYSHQAQRYGYESLGFVVCIGAIVPNEDVDPDEDPNDAEKIVRWARLPQEVRDSFERQIDGAIGRARAIADQYEETLDAEDAARAAEEAAIYGEDGDYADEE